MKLVPLLVVVTALVGCTGSAVMVRDGAAYPVDYNKATRTMSVSMDGETYSGGLIRNTSFGLAQSYGGGRIATGTAIGTNNQARATLMSPSNKILRCDLNLSFGSAQGICQDPQGRFYDVVAK